MFEDIIISAIQNRHCLKIYYNGERVIEPHCLGINTKGNLALRCWQQSGFSMSGNFSGWKLILVNDITQCQVLDNTFYPQLGYRKGDKGMSRIIAEV